jgi:hypothetical protein
MPPDGTADSPSAEDHQSYLSVAKWLAIVAGQLRDEGQHAAANVLDRLLDERLRTTADYRRATRRRWEIHLLRRSLDATLGGLRPVSPELVEQASQRAVAELRTAGLYGPASAQVLEAA